MPATNKPLSFDVFPGHIYIRNIISTTHSENPRFRNTRFTSLLLLRRNVTWILFLGNLTQKRLNLVAKRIAGVPRVFSSFRNRLRSSVERKPRMIWELVKKKKNDRAYDGLYWLTLSVYNKSNFSVQIELRMTLCWYFHIKLYKD